jgi:hypothetical protein
MTYPRNDDHFLIFSGSPGDLWQFVQKSTHKAAVVVGRPRGPLFTAARHCGTAHNYFPPPVSPKKKERRKNYTTKNNNTIKNSQRSAAAAAQERQKIRNKSIILHGNEDVCYYYQVDKKTIDSHREMHTHTHTQGGKWSSPGALYSCPILEGPTLQRFLSSQVSFFSFISSKF